MNIEVFHWRVDPKSTSNPEVTGTMAKLMMGMDNCVQSILSDHSKWAEMGLSLVKVADVQAHSLDHAFTLTNHIDKDWTSNPGVSHAPGIRHRSTSVGDLLRVGGSFHAVANTGFTPITVQPELADSLAASWKQQTTLVHTKLTP